MWGPRCMTADTVIAACSRRASCGGGGPAEKHHKAVVALSLHLWLSRGSGRTCWANAQAAAPYLCAIPPYLSLRASHECTSYNLRACVISVPLHCCHCCGTSHAGLDAGKLKIGEREGRSWPHMAVVMLWWPERPHAELAFPNAVSRAVTLCIQMCMGHLGGYVCEASGDRWYMVFRRVRTVRSTPACM